MDLYWNRSVYIPTPTHKYLYSLFACKRCLDCHLFFLEFFWEIFCRSSQFHLFDKFLPSSILDSNPKHKFQVPTNNKVSGGESHNFYMSFYSGIWNFHDFREFSANQRWIRTLSSNFGNGWKWKLEHFFTQMLDTETCLDAQLGFPSLMWH